jgi:acyl-CoA thioester hydrolase
MQNPSDFDPPTSAYRHGFSVESADIDALGHANNVVWVRWVNEAAIEHSRSVGLGPDFVLAQQVVWVVRRHDIEYLLPAFEGERLEAFTWVATVRGATSIRRTAIRREGRLLSRAETTWALVDTATSKPCRVPKEMLLKYGFEEQPPSERKRLE